MRRNNGNEAYNPFMVPEPNISDMNPFTPSASNKTWTQSSYATPVENAFEFFKDEFTQKSCLRELRAQKEVFHFLCQEEQQRCGMNLQQTKKEVRQNLKRIQNYRILTKGELRQNVRNYIIKWTHLLDQDLFAEGVEAAKRLCNWTTYRLRKEGLVLQNLTYVKEGKNLDQSLRLRFGTNRKSLPEHNLEPGCTVVVSRKCPILEYKHTVFAEVDYCSSNFIILRKDGDIAPGSILDLSNTKGKTFRLDRGPNQIIISRYSNTLSKFSGPLLTSSCAMRNILCRLTKEFYPKAEDFKYFNGEIELKNIILEDEEKKDEYQKGETIFNQLLLFNPTLQREDFTYEELGVWHWNLDQMNEQLDLLIPGLLLDSLSDILDREIDIYEYKNRNSNKWEVTNLLEDYDMAVKAHLLRKLQLLKPEIEFDDYFKGDQMPRWDVPAIKADLEAARSVEEQIQRKTGELKEDAQFQWPTDIPKAHWNNSHFISSEDMEKVNNYLLDTEDLNVSQCQALINCITKRVSCIQGPPGTGKTSTAIHLIYIYVKILKRTPVLASAFSNVAANHILAGLHERKINCCRIGQSKKVDDDLRETLLEVQRMNHPKMKKVLHLQREADDLHEEMVEVKRHGERWVALHNQEKQYRRLVLKAKDEIQKEILAADVIVATCIGISSHRLRDHEFSLVVIDECTQSTEPSTLLPISKCGGQLVLIGDQCQLPPVIKTDHLRYSDLKVSLFDRLIQQEDKHDAGINACLLKTQYRMHPIISLWPNLMFYNGKLSDGVTANRRIPPKGFPWPETGPLAFVPIEGKESNALGTSKMNVAEAEVAFDIVNNLLRQHEGDMIPQKIGIVTPYAAQVMHLKKMFNKKIYRGLEIKSVDGYQGREKEVIIFCTVRSNPHGNVGFVSDKRRINVALTRARRGLIVLGNYDTLVTNTSWRSWVRFVDYNHLIVSPRDLYFKWRIPPPRTIVIPDATFDYYDKPIWRTANYGDDDTLFDKHRQKTVDHYDQYWKRKRRSRRSRRSRGRQKEDRSASRIRRKRLSGSRSRSRTRRRRSVSRERRKKRRRSRSRSPERRRSRTRERRRRRSMSRSPDRWRK